MSKVGDIVGGSIGGIILALILAYLIAYTVIESFRRRVKDKAPKIGKISDVLSLPFRKIKDAINRSGYKSVGGYGSYNKYGYGYRPYSLYSPGYSSW